MTTIAAAILFLIFLFLSGIHVYWTFGGQWGTGAVIPTKDDAEKGIMPGIIATVIVALGLLGFGLIAFMYFIIPTPNFPAWLYMIRKYGIWVIAIIFTIRTIGDFNYVGFFKKIKHTKFAINDTKFYSPLCLIVGGLAILLIIFSCGEVRGNEVHLAVKGTISTSTKDLVTNSAEHITDYIVYGRFCGECGGECATMYKYDVANNKLFVDHTDSYWKYENGETMKVETAVTDLKILARAKELSENLPDFILNAENTEQSFGCPDCTDGCGLFFEIKKDNAVKKFYIDNQTDKLEGDVKSFAEDLQQVLRSK